MEKPINLNEAVQRIKKAGEHNVRSVPMAGQNVHSGLYAIEILDEGHWVIVAEGMTKTTADNIITQATNRVICG